MPVYSQKQIRIPDEHRRILLLWQPNCRSGKIIIRRHCVNVQNFVSGGCVMIRKKVIYCLACGTCCVFLAYGLLVQALRGSESAQAAGIDWVLEAPASADASMEQQAADGQTGKLLPESNSDETVPESIADQTIPKGSVDQAVQENTADQTIPESNVDQTLPENTADQMIPEDNADETISENGLNDRTPDSEAETPDSFYADDAGYSRHGKQHGRNEGNGGKHRRGF